MAEETVGRTLLLEGLPASEAAEAAAVLNACSVVDIPARASRGGASLGDATLLLVDEGLVAIRRTSSSTTPILCCEAAPGMLLIPPAAGETLEALTEARVVAIPHDACDRLLARPGVALAFVEMLAGALAQQRESIDHLARPRHADRVRGKLLELARKFGRVAPDGVRIDFPITHQLLAEMLASSRETVTRAVDELQRDGFVARDGHTYRLLVPPTALDAAVVEV